MEYRYLEAHLPYWVGLQELTYVLTGLLAPRVQANVMRWVPENGEWISPDVLLRIYLGGEHALPLCFELDCDADGGRILGSYRSPFVVFLLSRVVDTVGGYLITREGHRLHTSAGVRLPRKSRDGSSRLAYPTLNRQLARWRFEADEIVMLQGMIRFAYDEARDQWLPLDFR
ncbi:MAG: hypothetical protein ACXVXZ_01715 [Mycobacteriaceae bacterium]